MDRKFKYKIILALRKLTFSYPERNKAKKRSKIGPELWKCETCSRQIYTGKRDIDFIKVKYPKAESGKMHMDHINPAVALEGESDDWNVTINRMFPMEEGWQNICAECHLVKTAYENGERARIKKERK